MNFTKDTIELFKHFSINTLAITTVFVSGALFEQGRTSDPHFFIGFLLFLAGIYLCIEGNEIGQ